MFAVFYGASKVFSGTRAECSEYVRKVAAASVTSWWIGELTGAGWMTVE
jgi:hypothetical protein